MVTRRWGRAWIVLSGVLYGLALVVPALSVRQVAPELVRVGGSVAGYICLSFGWLLFTTAFKGGLTVFFALSWLANIAWVLSLIAFARRSGRAVAFAGIAVALALLVLIPVISQAPVYDGADELIYGIDLGYMLWVTALAAALVAAVIIRRREAAAPMAASAD